jgi:hypothetical protein
MPVTLAAGDLERNAPEPRPVRLLKDAPDVAVAVEDVVVFVLPGTAFAGDVGAAKDKLHETSASALGSIPPPRDQPAALVLRDLELLDRLLDRGLLIRSVKNSDESGGRPADVVDGQGVLVLFARSLGHRERR